VIANRTVVPNPFWCGALFPLIVLGALLSWPWLERRVTGDYAVHNLLERPRDRPWRTAIGVAFLTWVILIFMFGSADRVYVLLGISYQWQLWAYRVAVFVLPVIALFVTRWICLNLKSIEDREHDRELAEEEAAEAARTRALATAPSAGDG
jgi:ubiquinol-cytochrome c reductase cytochrome b subunit